MVGIAERDYYTVAEAATVLDVSPSTVLRWIKSGLLPAQRVGPKNLRIQKADVKNMERPVEVERITETARVPLINFAERPAIKGLVVPRLTEEERASAREAFRLADELRARILARRGGVPLASSDILIQESREERSRQLLQ